MLGVGLAVLLLAGPAHSGDAVGESGAHGSTGLGSDPNSSENAPLASLGQGQQEATTDPDRLHQALADVQMRLTAIEQQGGLAGLIAAQTAVIADLARRLEGATPDAVVDAANVDAGAAGSPSAGQGAGSASAADASGPLADEVAGLQTQLAATEQRLHLLIEQFATAQQLREQATAQATEARAQLAELNARQQQARLELQEAQLRADKAEKGYAALEQVHERGVTERERLSAELNTTRERLAESLRHTLALDTRLANAEARAAQLTNGTAPRPPPRSPPGNETAHLDGAGAGIAGGIGAEHRTVSQATADAAEVPAEFLSETSVPEDAPSEMLPTSAPPPGAGTDGRIEPPRPQAATTTTSGPTPAGNGRRDGHPAVYSVRADDSLSKISVKVYGNAADWPRIYEANRDVLSTPDKLAPGMMLVIP